VNSTEKHSDSSDSNATLPNDFSKNVFTTFYRDSFLVTVRENELYNRFKPSIGESKEKDSNTFTSIVNFQYLERFNPTKSPDGTTTQKSESETIYQIIPLIRLEDATPKNYYGNHVVLLKFLRCPLHAMYDPIFSKTIHKENNPINSLMFKEKEMKRKVDSSDFSDVVLLHKIDEQIDFRTLERMYLADTRLFTITKRTYDARNIFPMILPPSCLYLLLQKKMGERRLRDIWNRSLDEDSSTSSRKLHPPLSEERDGSKDWRSEIMNYVSSGIFEEEKKGTLTVDILDPCTSMTTMSLNHFYMCLNGYLSSGLKRFGSLSQEEQIKEVSSKKEKKESNEEEKKSYGNIVYEEYDRLNMLLMRTGEDVLKSFRSFASEILQNRMGCGNLLYPASSTFPSFLETVESLSIKSFVDVYKFILHASSVSSKDDDKSSPPEENENGENKIPPHHIVKMFVFNMRCFNSELATRTIHLKEVFFLKLSGVEKSCPTTKSQEEMRSQGKFLDWPNVGEDYTFKSRLQKELKLHSSFPDPSKDEICSRSNEENTGAIHVREDFHQFETYREDAKQSYLNGIHQCWSDLLTPVNSYTMPNTIVESDSTTYNSHSSEISERLKQYRKSCLLEMLISLGTACTSALEDFQKRCKSSSKKGERKEITGEAVFIKKRLRKNLDILQLTLKEISDSSPLMFHEMIEFIYYFILVWKIDLVEFIDHISESF
jgi:hypothetical protein